MDYFVWIPERITELRMQKGVSSRDMSLSLGQSESYVNKIENHRTMPSITGLIYICEYFGITLQEFFDTEPLSPERSREILNEIKKLTPAQAEHILQVIRDLGEKR